MNARPEYRVGTLAPDRRSLPAVHAHDGESCYAAAAALALVHSRIHGTREVVGVSARGEIIALAYCGRLYEIADLDETEEIEGRVEC